MSRNPRPWGTVALLVGICPPVWATSLQLSHSGMLLSGTDAPVDSSGVPMVFRIVDRPVSDPAEFVLWSGSCAPRVTAGRYAVVLGDGTCGTNLPSSVLPPDQQRFLDVSVGGISLSPRLRLGTVPTAAYAADAGSIGGQSLAALDGRFVRAQSGTATVQTGSISLSGQVQAGSFIGSGVGLTGLDASQLAAGVIPNARLSSEVPLLSGGLLSDAILPLSLIRTTGAQSIGGNKTFTALTSMTGGLDLGGSELRGVRLENASSAPSGCDASMAGRMYFDTTLQATRVCRQAAWTSLTDSSTQQTAGQLATYTTATRPTDVNPGHIIFNSGTKAVEVWTGSAWVRVGGESVSVEATGGTVTMVGNYKVHTFTSTGVFNVTAAETGATVEVLVVGGGGGGGIWYAGGGGGGGVVYATAVPVSTGSIAVTVGDGGLGQSENPSTAATQASYGRRGGDSSFGSGLVARGGGGGPGYNGTPTDPLEFKFTDGGSGGGGRMNGYGAEGRPSRTYTSVATVGTAQVFGHRGGRDDGSSFGGGGGGAGSPGNSGSVDGKGGDGIFFNMDGTATYYGAGGGGGTAGGTAAGGRGGGGNGATGSGGHATGYGNGGGSGGSSGPSGVAGGNGSKGVVIVRYPVKKLTVQTFSTVGTSAWTVPAGVNSASVLVVGGGGGGAGSGGSGSGPRGGGGAGGFVWDPAHTLTPGATVSVTVGAGGAGGSSGGENSGSNGANSVFGTLTAIGGGAGGSYSGENLSGGSGGSGGGGSYLASRSAFNAGTIHQGYRGGTSQMYGIEGASGGGGAGGSGYDIRQSREPSGGDKGSGTGGDGGEGRLCSISGTPVYYAGGGGAGAYPQGNTNWGLGGSGVGGAGASGSGTATAGSIGTGSGGGAGGSGSAGAAGGSGIVIVAY